MKDRRILLIVALGLLIICMAAIVMTAIAATGTATPETPLKILGIVMLALGALTALNSQRVAKLCTDPQNIVEGIRKLLKVVTALVIAMGIVAIIAACLWQSPMRAFCLVGGLTAFGGGYILAMAIRREKPLPSGMPKPTASEQGPPDSHRKRGLVINPALLVVSIVLVAAIAITWWFYTHPPL